MSKQQSSVLPFWEKIVQAISASQLLKMDTSKELYRNGSTIILCYVPHEICWGISVVQLVGLITEKNRAIVADCASTAGLADSAQIWAGY